MNEKISSNMVQYGIWPNCCNSCDFCLRKDRLPISKEWQIYNLNYIKKNINYIDWKNKFSAGISLLGGELYYITDEQIQKAFLELIDVIIEKILKVSSDKNCRFSTVTNGLYDPSFLYKVIDKIADSVGINYIDLNFSYDFKYRFKTKDDEEKVLKNINDFHKRYQYKVGVQMILTQNVINLWKDGNFDINKFILEKIPGNNFCFLYPHKICTGKILDDFFFKRNDFIKFLTYLKSTNFDVYKSFIQSTKNSAIFKYSGFYDRQSSDIQQQPILCDDKNILNEKCQHSILYKCYSDTDKCMLCDIENFDTDGLI